MGIQAKKGYFAGVVLSLLLISFFSLSDLHYLRAPGPFNTGHENLSCEACHEVVDTSFRQQVQANISYLFGNRGSLTAFNFSFPDNKDCLDCHSREDDSHPVYRFNEPRFKEARKAVQPQYCVSCHQEHKGIRVTSNPENCRYCHEDIEVKNDPLDISHEDIIKLEDWDTCLTCHDFHGNHRMKVPTNTVNRLQLEEIEEYFLGGKDPYSDEKITQSREARYENK